MELVMARVLLLAHEGMLVSTAMQTQARVGGEVLANSLKPMTWSAPYCTPSDGEHPHCSGVDVPAILSFVAFAPAKKPCMKSALIPSCPMSLTTSPSLSNPFP